MKKTEEESAGCKEGSDLTPVMKEGRLNFRGGLPRAHTCHVRNISW
jgi:hypothetical protein